MNYKIIPMTNDRVFKSVLSSIEARDYLIDIISGITGLPKANLKKDMTFVDSEHRISSKNESKKISDLVVEVKDNVINLEMNNTYYKKLVDRNFEYIAKLKSNLIGESYNKIRKVIQINFDNFNRYNDDRVVIKFEMRDEKGIKEIIKNTKHVKVTKWHDYAYDIVPKTGGKAAAIQAVSKHFDYQKEELMAFGDGHNDIEMLDVVGYPIVMENGSDEVKQHACYICDDVEKEGILKGLKHFNLID